MADAQSNSKRRLLFAGIITLALAFSTVYLVHYYGETRPAVAQPEIGRTHPATIHQKTVYLTDGEYALAIGTHIVAIIAIGVFIGLLLRSRVKKSPPPA